MHISASFPHKRYQPPHKIKVPFQQTVKQASSQNWCCGMHHAAYVCAIKMPAHTHANTQTHAHTRLLLSCSYAILFEKHIPPPSLSSHSASANNSNDCRPRLAAPSEAFASFYLIWIVLWMANIFALTGQEDTPLTKFCPLSGHFWPLCPSLPPKLIKCA